MSNKANIKIYEDQTGLMLFPEKRTDKDREIVRFFDNKINLYIKKSENNIEMCIYIKAQKGLERPLGYYIIYIGNYDNNFFTNFRRNIDITLHDLKLQPLSGDKENTVFDNIGRFDSIGRLSGDINVIRNAIGSNDYLGYRCGNIGDISTFCNQILKNINNIKIAISSEDSTLGQINILIDKRYEEPLTPNDRTIDILNRYRTRLWNNKKSIEGRPGKDKIAEGRDSIKEGIRRLESSGHSSTEIQNILENMTLGEKWIVKLKDVGPPVIEKMKIEEKKTSMADIIFKVCVAIAIFSVISSLAFIYKPDLRDNIKDKIYGTPHTPVPTIIPTPTSITPVLIEEEPLLFNITGFVSNDITHKGIPNWTIVLLDDNGNKKDNTNSNQEGFYIFSQLKNGTYNVTEMMQEGWKNNDPTFQTIVVNGKDESVNFTNRMIIR